MFEVSARSPFTVHRSPKSPSFPAPPRALPRRQDALRQDPRPHTNKTVPDKTAVHYNEHLTIRNIPLEAYDYLVNGKPALEWVMERQSVTTDKASHITNDANLWATETMGDARYPLDLFRRMVTVSLETMKIVRGLPGVGELRQKATFPFEPWRNK